MRNEIIIVMLDALKQALKVFRGKDVGKSVGHVVKTAKRVAQETGRGT